MVDVSLALYYLAWFVGNYYYTLWNKLASVEAGGKAGGLLVTISVMQLAVCSVYAILLWVVGYNPVGLVGLQKPTKQSVPKITLADVGSMLVLVCCYAGAHSAGVVALTAGSPQFGQIVKAAEPVFSAVVNTIIYANSPSLAKWCCLPLIVGGVAISTLKPSAAGGYSIEFDTTALMAGSVNNMFAAFKGSENKKVMERAGLKERLGGTGNQFGVTNVLALLVSLPVMVALEVHAPSPRALESASSRPPARSPAQARAPTPRRRVARTRRARSGPSSSRSSKRTPRSATTSSRRAQCSTCAAHSFLLPPATRRISELLLCRLRGASELLSCRPRGASELLSGRPRVTGTTSSRRSRSRRRRR